MLFAQVMPVTKWTKLPHGAYAIISFTPAKPLSLFPIVITASTMSVDETVHDSV